MCGITGFNWNDKQLLKRMCDSIAHRGPNQHSYYFDKQISLGHRRLSIIDLSEKGKQPMCNEDGTIWITFNGEIYNYAELKPELEQKGHKFFSATDTETIIHLYEEYGENCVEKLHGDFAFAIYDSNKKKIFLARDRIGVKPLYYYFNFAKKEFLFASEIKALLEYEEIKREVKLESLRQYLTYRYIFGRHTIFENISRILPAECATFDIKTSTLQIRKYWDENPCDKNIIKKSEKYYLKKFTQLYQDSVQKRLMSDVPLGVYLSGGIDSSSIVSMMHEIKNQQQDIGEIKTFSIGFGYGKETDEFEYSRAVSQHFGTKHKEFTIDSNAICALPKIIWHCDEPLADPALIPAYFLSKEAKKHATVVLTGDGADETFAGYEQAKFMILANKIAKIPLAKKILPLGLNITPNFILNKIFKYSTGIGKEGLKRASQMLSNIDNKAKAYTSITGMFCDSEIKKICTSKITSTPSAVYEMQKEFFENNKNKLLNQILYMETKTLLPENMLMKTDKMTMAHAIEARVPLLDHRLTELAFQMPTHLKLNGWKEKYILKTAMKNKLPKQIVQRKKQRFYVPIDKWIKEDIMPVVDDLLSTKTIAAQGYLNPAEISKMMQKYNTAPLFYARQLWTLINFQIWHAIYIDKKNPKKIL